MSIFGIEPFCLDWGMMDKAFDSVLTAKTAYPVDMVKVTAKDKVSYEIRVALAGIDKDEISVELDKNDLIITIDPNDDKPVEYVEEYLRKGIKTSNVVFKYALGTGIDADKISSSFNNGLLVIKLPTVEVKKPKKVSIK